MNKTIAIIVVALAVIGIGVWLLFGQEQDNGANNEQSAPQERQEAREQVDDEAEEVTTVAYTDDGFEPATIRVESGTTVTWENQSDSPMWVASDPHPSHQDLPEFDAQNNIAPGGEYSFTFEEAGEWGYHDHLNSFRTGTVIVE